MNGITGGEFENWSNLDQLDASLGSNFRVEFLNQYLEVFEAMVEPTNIAVNLRSSSQSSVVTINQLNINLTQTFVDTLMKTVKSITNVLDQNANQSPNYAKKSLSHVTLKKPDAYYLRNDSGIFIYYSLDGEGTEILAAGEEVSFSQNHSGGTLRLGISPDAPKIDSILIDKIGRNRLKVLASKEGPLATCDVTFRNAGKLLSVRSNFIFVNFLKIAIHILVYADQVDNYQYLLAPDEKFPVPLSHMVNTHYSFAPTSDKFHFTFDIYFIPRHLY